MRATTNERRYRNGSKPYDTQCKIATLGGKFLFASAGVPIWNSPKYPMKWTNLGVALTAYRKTAGRRRRLSAFVETWKSTIHEDWSKMYRLSPDAVIAESDPHDGGLTSVFVAGIEDGRPEVYYIFVGVYPNHLDPIFVNHKRLADHPVSEYPGGMGDGTPVYLALKKEANPKFTAILPTEADPPAVATQRMIALQEWITNEMVGELGEKSTVGGATDVVELWTDGTIHWVRRKRNCPKQEK